MHELVHVAQYQDYGRFKFVMKYIGQWIKSGFSYDKMKSFGLEEEACVVEAKFRELVT
jgi:hypothetical protein